MSKKNKMYQIDEVSFLTEKEELELCLDFETLQDMRSKRLVLRDSKVIESKKRYNRKKIKKELDNIIE